MDPVTIGLIAVAVLVIAIISGIHIAVSLGLISFIGVWIISGNLQIAMSMIASVSFGGIRQYSYTVLPLFMVMGTLISASGVAGDLYDLMQRGIKRLKLPGGLAIATVWGNAIFAAVTGVSIAAAALFSKVSYPEMKKLHYSDELSLGVIAGSSVLGMLIPPSALFIIYGVLTGEAIGKLFMSGVFPGLLLAFLFCVTIIVRITLNPALEDTRLTKGKGESDAVLADKRVELDEEIKPLTTKKVFSGLTVILLIIIIFGGIWFGWFTPTEAAAIGCICGLIIALLKGIGINGVWDAIWSAASATAPVLLLLISGSMYAKLIAYSGLLQRLNEIIVAANLPGWGFLAFCVLVWVLLGFIVDSASIILITVPIFTPILVNFGFPPMWIAVVCILAVEIGLLTPPFGMCVYATKSSIPDESVKIETIFKGSLPFAVMMLIGLILVLLFPILATFIPGKM